MLAILLLLVGIFSRIIFHTPNFTPIIALALFAGTYLKRKHAFIVPLALMVISDLMIGLHNIVLFTWGSVVLIALIGLWLRQHKRPTNIFGSSLLSALLFFVITNFGAWLVMYPPTIEGFGNCYIAAIPFFRHTLLSTLIFSFILFGLYEMIAHFVKNTRYAKVLLTA